MHDDWLDDFRVVGEITRAAPAAECNRCAALVAYDGRSMGAHLAWHSALNG